MEDSALRFLMEEVQYVALSIMGIVYVLKVIWLLKRPLPVDKAPLKGNGRAAGLVSLANIFMPWSMESTRRHWWFYLEFVVFHVGVASAIAATFIFPLAPQLMVLTLKKVFLVIIALALLVGIRRLLRRIIKTEMRIISSPDDYFSLIVLDLFFVSAIWAIYTEEAMALWVFFLMTTFFLIYVPFSKISHYITYPFGRYLFGVNFGGRGAYGLRK